MKFAMKKKDILNQLSKIVEVSTKGVKTDYEKSNKLTIKVDKNKVILSTSNGNMDIISELTKDNEPSLSIDSDGTTSVEASVLNKVISNLGDNNAVISLTVNSDSGTDVLLLTDLTAKKKKVVKIETRSEHHNITISKPKDGFKYVFDSEEFRRSVNTISKYTLKLESKPIYEMICLHFLSNETRFIAGSGVRFAVLSNTINNSDIKANEDKKFIIPSEQAKIVANVIQNSNQVEFIYKDAQTCYIKPQNGITLMLKGIPNETYMSYDKYAFRQDKSKTIIDVKKEDLLSAMKVIGSTEDKDSTDFHHCNFSIKDDGIQFVSEGRYAAEVQCDAEISGNKDFKSCYAYMFLNEMANAHENAYLRFYFIEPTDTVIVEPVDLTDKKDSTGLFLPNVTNPKLSFFFAAAVDE